MICPICGGKVVVADVVHNTENNSIIRKRLCANGHQHFSVEKIIFPVPKLIDDWWKFHR